MAGSVLAASAANPGTSSGQRARPMTWTTAAAIPTGTAILIARWVDSRPTPTAIGANRADARAITVNQAMTRRLVGAERGQDVVDRLLEDVGIVEDGAEDGEGGVGEDGGGDQQCCGQSGGHDCFLGVGVADWWRGLSHRGGDRGVRIELTVVVVGVGVVEVVPAAADQEPEDQRDLADEGELPDADRVVRVPARFRSRRRGSRGRRSPAGCRRSSA